MNRYWYRNILGWTNIGLSLFFLAIGLAISPLIAIVISIITGFSGVILIRDFFKEEKPFWYGGK
jgi:uncharacterized membrane protein YeiH